jgi:hypothetical protein
VLWLDEVLELARAEQAVAAVLKASGKFKNADGSDIQIPDPRVARREFDANLRKPLNDDRVRAAVLKAVTA